MSAPKNFSPAQKKGAQPALTLCEAPQLDWSRESGPASESFGDIYFSVEGGLEETRAVYLDACGLPQRWAEEAFKRRAFVIAELGFGTGLNFLAALELWRAGKAAGQIEAHQRLHFVSIEKHPLAAEDLSRALERWPELKEEASALLQVWPGRVRGTHIVHMDGGVTLTLCHDDVNAALAGLSLKADAWFLDGFSPAKNPAMWSESVMARIGELSRVGAQIGTFTAAGFVREGLSKAGFDVRRVAGFGRKRHSIKAVMPAVGDNDKAADAAQGGRPIRPIIIGGGIAGACLAEHFARRGIEAVVIDPDDGTAASGNAAAIVKPRLDRQDSPLARFALCAYLYAGGHYPRRGAVLSSGVVHAPQTEDQIMRHKALAETPALPPQHMAWRDGALHFPKAQVVDPAAARSASLLGARVIKGRAEHYRKSGTALEVLGASGDVLAAGTHVIFTAGAGVRALPDFDEFELRYSRGQISWAENDARETALTYGGYAVPLGEGLLLGATHARLMDGDPYALSPEDDASNFQAYEKAAGRAAQPSSWPSRASVRVNSKTTWPFIAQMDETVFAITGLGSRGFVFAPLMTEMLAAHIIGEPVFWPEKLLRAAHRP